MLTYDEENRCFIDSDRSNSLLNDIKKEEILKEIEENTGRDGEWKEIRLECPHCTSDNFVYIYEDKTCYCVQCDEEFDAKDILGFEGDLNLDSLEDKEIQQKIEDMVSDDPEVVRQMADRIVTGEIKNEPKQLQLPGKTLGSSYSDFKSYAFSNCTHRPQQIIDGDGWGVWAGKKEDCKYYAKDFDVVLNLTFTSIKEPHVIPIPELREFEEYDCNYIEIQLDWPDYGTINMPKEFWVRLLQYLERNKARMLVFCLGGHGRTGTALAVMMCLALDYTPEEAFEWIRKNYCWSAVETNGQEEYVRKIIGTEKKSLLNEAVIKYVDKMSAKGHKE